MRQADLDEDVFPAIEEQRSHKEQLAARRQESQRKPKYTEPERTDKQSKNMAKLPANKSAASMNNKEGPKPAKKTVKASKPLTPYVNAGVTAEQAKMLKPCKRKAEVLEATADQAKNYPQELAQESIKDQAKVAITEDKKSSEIDGSSNPESTRKYNYRNKPYAKGNVSLEQKIMLNLKRRGWSYDGVYKIHCEMTDKPRTLSTLKLNLHRLELTFKDDEIQINPEEVARKQPSIAHLFRELGTSPAHQSDRSLSADSQNASPSFTPPSDSEAKEDEAKSDVAQDDIPNSRASSADDKVDACENTSEYSDAKEEHAAVLDNDSVTKSDVVAENQQAESSSRFAEITVDVDENDNQARYTYVVMSRKWLSGTTPRNGSFIISDVTYDFMDAANDAAAALFESFKLEAKPLEGFTFETDERGHYYYNVWSSSVNYEVRSHRAIDTADTRFLKAPKIHGFKKPIYAVMKQVTSQKYSLDESTDDEVVAPTIVNEPNGLSYTDSDTDDDYSDSSEDDEDQPVVKKQKISPTKSRPAVSIKATRPPKASISSLKHVVVDIGFTDRDLANRKASRVLLDTIAHEHERLYCRSADNLDINEAILEQHLDHCFEHGKSFHYSEDIEHVKVRVWVAQSYLKGPLNI